jgi:inorganic pyrophosphatase/exopolyphosphatase
MGINLNMGCLCHKTLSVRERILSPGEVFADYEKQNTARLRTVWQEALNMDSPIVVTGHANPDADAVTSMLAAAEQLKRCGKQAVLYFNDSDLAAVRRNNTLNKLLKEYAGAIYTEKSLSLPEGFGRSMLCVDVAGASMLPEYLRKLSAGLNSQPVLLDHHARNGETDKNTFANNNYFSTTALLAELSYIHNLPLSKELARCLLYGLAGDTRGGRHNLIIRNKDTPEQKYHKERNQRLAEKLAGIVDPAKTFWELLAEYNTELSESNYTVEDRDIVHKLVHGSTRHVPLNLNGQRLLNVSIVDAGEYSEGDWRKCLQDDLGFGRHASDVILIRYKKDGAYKYSLSFFNDAEGIKDNIHQRSPENYVEKGLVGFARLFDPRGGGHAGAVGFAVAAENVFSDIAYVDEFILVQDVLQVWLEIMPWYVDEDGDIVLKNEILRNKIISDIKSILLNRS